jgi:quinoprotein dehydrogenase-associated probable ABC transporter substrate-binding protein
MRALAQLARGVLGREYMLGLPAACLAAALLVPRTGAGRGVAPTPAADTARVTMLAAAHAVLRVCADPNNLPFSSRAGEGFENHLAALLAQAMGVRVQYTWWPQRRGFLRHTLDAKRCDVIMGIPPGYPGVLTTRPYYRSTYVFVTRADRHYALHSLNDAVLHHVRIGLQFTGGRANPPAEHALARRHIVRNIVAYSIYGDYARPNPPARLIDAVARGDVDVAIAWGPLAGYFARREPVPLRITPVSPAVDGPGVSFVFDIALGVAQGDTARRNALQRALDAERGQVARLLQEYSVPLLPDSEPPAPVQARTITTAAGEQ